MYQRVLDAAVEVIAENRLLRCNDQIDRGAGRCVDGTEYLYFESKDEVLESATDRKFDCFHQKVIERFADLHDPREELEFNAQ